MLYSGNIEPPLRELLEDPIADLLRRSDGLTLETVQACADAARRRLRGPAAQPRPASVCRNLRQTAWG